MLLLQNGDQKLVARLARGLQLCPRVVLACCGGEVLDNVECYLEMACATMPFCWTDRDERNKLLEACACGIPLWLLKEFNSWAVRPEVEQARMLLGFKEQLPCSSNNRPSYAPPRPQRSRGLASDGERQGLMRAKKE